MGRNPKHLLPQMRLHAQSGHARVRINGKTFWLGRFGSPEAKDEYDRLIAEYLSSRTVGRRPAQGKEAAASPVISDQAIEQAAQAVVSAYPPVADQVDLPAVTVEVKPPAELTVSELCVVYMDHARTYYKLPDGRLSSSYHGMLQAVNALRPFKRLPAASFGPRSLREIMERLVHEKTRKGKPWPRKSINRLIKRIRSLFKWAVTMEMVPAQTWHALLAVEGLRQGRSPAPELPPVKAVADTIVKKTLPHLPDVVADLVMFIRYSGCRPGEACMLRAVDIDRTGNVWKWTLSSHKNAWREQGRVIMLGPKAQKIIGPYLDRLRTKPFGYCFSPAESEKARNNVRKQNRKSPMTPSQRARRPKPMKSRKKPPRPYYADDTLNRCIRRACEKAGIPRWTPMQLRHAAGTEARKSGGGLDAAQVRLGHKHASITEVYAELAQEKAAKLALKLG